MGVISRLKSFFTGYQPTPTAELVQAVQEKIDRTPRQTRPASDEKIPQNYLGGIAGKIWFQPYLDSTTKDTPEIRQAMRNMLRDPWVKTAWEPQILTVASEDTQVQAAESGNPDSEEQADFCKKMIDDYTAGGMTEAVRSVLAPLGPDGFSLVEPVWGYAAGGILNGKFVVEALKAKDCDTVTGAIRLEGDRYGNVTHVRTNRKGAGEQNVWGIEEFLFTRYMPVFDEPLGCAAYRSVYSAWWMLDTVMKLRIIHHEKKMAGTTIGTYADDDDKPSLETTMSRLKSSTWAVIPEGVKIESLQLSQAAEPDYKSFCESLRETIVTGIAFATLQSIQGNVPDARGDSKVQKAMADLGPWYLMVLTSTAINRLFRRAVDYNYPYPAGGGYPKLTFGSVSNTELLELVQLVEGYQRLGFKPSKNHYAKSLSVQESDPNDPDDQLQSAGGGGLGGMLGGLGGGGEQPFAFGERRRSSRVYSFAERPGPYAVRALALSRAGAVLTRHAGVGSRIVTRSPTKFAELNGTRKHVRRLFAESFRGAEKRHGTLAATVASALATAVRGKDGADLGSVAVAARNLLGMIPTGVA